MEGFLIFIWVTLGLAGVGLCIAMGMPFKILLLRQKVVYARVGSRGTQGGDDDDFMERNRYRYDPMKDLTHPANPINQSVNQGDSKYF